MWQAITNKLSFIAWVNFTDPGILWQWFLLIVAVMAFMFLCFALGRLITGDKAFAGGSERFVLYVAAGMAICSFTLALLGISDLLRPVVVAGLPIAAALFAAASAAGRRFLAGSGSAFFDGIFRNRWLWILLLCNSLPALLPPHRWDSMSYHLPYALQWAREGGLTVDPAMRYPLFTFNFHMLYVPGMMAGSAAFAHAMTWIAGSLGCLGVMAFLRRLGVSPLIASVAGIAFLLTPVVQRNLNNAYIDVPLMSFLLLCTYSLFMFYHNPRSRRMALLAGLTGAMFVGMKTSGAFFVPLLLAIPLSRYRRYAVRALWLYLLVFSAAGSFWYVRNIVHDGDPIPPAVNVMLGREDKFWSDADYRKMTVYMRRDMSWDVQSLLKLPVKMIFADKYPELRDWPVLGFIWVAPLLLLFPRRLVRNGLWIVAACTLYAALIWLLLIHTTRYAHYLCLAALCGGLAFQWAWTALQRRIPVIRSTWLVLPVALFLLAGPTGRALSYYIHNYSVKIPADIGEVNRFVGFGDASVLNLIQRLQTLGVKKDTVYTVGVTPYKYYFNLEGFHVVGDVVNPCRFEDLGDALRRGMLAGFLDECGCKALVIIKSTLQPMTGAGVKELYANLAATRRLRVLYDDKVYLVVSNQPSSPGQL